MAIMTAQKSTTVRTVTLTVLRGAMRSLERRAPGLGAVVAERLWCTVPRGRAVSPYPSGARFAVTVDGRAVEAEAWGEGPAVYLMHGWGGRRGQLASFVAPLVAAGHRVVALDAPGHGDSAPGAFGPGRGLLTEFATALRAVARVGGPAHAVIGHSAGGAASAIAVLDGLATERLVLIAPMASPIPYTSEFARALGFGERVRTGFLDRLERRIGRPVSDLDVPARAAGRDDLPSLLVVHDRDDKEVRPADGEAIAAAWSPAEGLWTTGLGHRRILRDEATVATVVDFLVASRVTGR